MNNKELLFNLIKKLDSGELILTNEDEKYTSTDDLFLKDKNTGEKVYIGRVEEEDCSDDACVIVIKDYEMNKNDKFKENFYQEKGLDKCQIMDCPNKNKRSFKRPISQREAYRRKRNKRL